jgi:hypothetical protein
LPCPKIRHDYFLLTRAAAHVREPALAAATKPVRLTPMRICDTV